MTTRLPSFQRASLGKLLIAEDDELWARALQKELIKKEFQVDVVSNFTDAESALKKFDYHAVVADVFLSPENPDGLELVKLAKHLGIPSVIMTSALDLEVAKNGLNYGADQLLEKPFQASTLASLLIDIWENPRGLIARRERCFSLSQLTEKERELCRLVLKGLSNQEIATISETTVGTVKFYTSQIFEKLGVKNRAELFNLVFPT